VLLSRRDYHKLTRPKPSLVELLRTPPLMNSGLKIERQQTATRKIKL
jgi:hypothetical protein